MIISSKFCLIQGGYTTWLNTSSVLCHSNWSLSSNQYFMVHATGFVVTADVPTVKDAILRILVQKIPYRKHQCNSVHEKLGQRLKNTSN